MNHSDTKEKLTGLADRLQEMGTVAIAFSGGVDSTFLLAYAQEVIGSNAFAVTAQSPAFSEEEMLEADAFCRQHQIQHYHISLEEDTLKEFAHNPPNRCYICKKAIFSRILTLAKAHGADYVADGTNLDDLGDYRPGLQALAELKVASPLKDAGLTKTEIRQALKERNIPVWNKPAFACLASRIPYGQEITAKKLRAVASLERMLHRNGFLQCRVRHHGEIARIEVLADQRCRFLEPGLMDLVAEAAREAGFAYAALDLSGYRTGSLNETVLNGQKGSL